MLYSLSVSLEYFTYFRLYLRFIFCACSSLFFACSETEIHTSTHPTSTTWSFMQQQKRQKRKPFTELNEWSVENYVFFLLLLLNNQLFVYCFSTTFTCKWDKNTIRWRKISIHFFGFYFGRIKLSLFLLRNLF